MESNNRLGGQITAVILSLVIIVIGVALYMYPDINFATFIWAFGVIMIAYGLIRAALYWVKNEYRDVKNYDFAIGLMEASVGIWMMTSSETLGESGVQIMGLAIMVDAVVMIQYALQIRMMDGKAFKFSIACAMLVYVLSLVALVEPGRIFSKNMRVFSVLMALSGAMGLLLMVLAIIRSRNLAREEHMNAVRDMEDEPELSEEELEEETKLLEEDDSFSDEEK